MNILSATHLKQFVLSRFIAGLVILLGAQLFTYFPGVLGAITFYILLRQWFFKLTVVYNWKKWLAALVFIVGVMLLFVIPFGCIVLITFPKISALIHNASQFSGGMNSILQKAQLLIPGIKIEETQLRDLAQKASAQVPNLLGATVTMITNLILCFFLLYFMLVDGRKMERRVQDYMPLKAENIDEVWLATRNMVVSNAIGIPLLALAQAIVATIGYYIFGISDFILWGVLTGVLSMIPVIGTAVICVPLCAFLFVTGKTGQGIGLVIYSLGVIGSVDNILRFTILKRLGDVHPIITVLGIMVGVPIFGFMGFIFGPLLISYLLLLVKIYHVEFSPRPR